MLLILVWRLIDNLAATSSNNNKSRGRTVRERFQEYVFQRGKALGISRTELARRARLSRESLYKLLRGDIANPSVETLHGLALALEVSPLYLLRQYFDDLNLGPGTLFPARHADDHASFVRDVTVPDDMAVGVNQSFVKVWEIQNTGSLHWHDRRLVCQDDEFVLARRTPDGGLQEVMDCHLLPAARSVPLPDAAPGEIVRASVEFTAPSFPCCVMSMWKIADAEGALCFPDFVGIWVRVRVVAL
jgi:transcriptional regulator with XRE-family HTH domain